MLPQKNVLMVGAFALPVVCCLIGIGAFVLLFATSGQGGGPDPNLLEKLKSLATDEARLDEHLASLRLRLQETEKGQESQKVLAQQVQELVGQVETGTANLLNEVSRLTEKFTQTETVIQTLETPPTKKQEPQVPDRTVRDLGTPGFGPDSRPAVDVPALTQRPNAEV
jgi:hypothetical protein